jgi:hypothetical protein
MAGDWRGRLLRGTLAVSLCALAVLASSSSARALVVEERVNTTADRSLAENPNYCEQGEGAGKETCPLRAAIEAASRTINAAGGEEVAVVVPEGHYVLSQGPLPLGDTHEHSCGPEGAKFTCGVRLQGAGAGRTVIDAEYKSELIAPIDHAGALAVAGVTLRRGKAEYGGAVGWPTFGYASLTVRESLLTEDVAEKNGGAIYDFAVPIIVRDSSFTNDSGHSGGAIAAEDTTVSIARSTFSGDSAELDGGAVSMTQEHVASTLTVTDSTFAANTAERGAALWSFGDATTNLDYSTVAGNTAKISSGGVGASEAFAKLTLVGSILSGNTPNQCNEAGTVEASGANIIFGNSTCAVKGAPPLGVDPLLGPLSANGGLGATMPLLRGSPAVNAGGAACPGADAGDGPLDERHVARPMGAGCDLGAFESAADAAVSLSPSPASGSVGSPLVLTGAVVDAGTDPVTGARISISIPVGTGLMSVPAGCNAAFGATTTVSCQLGAIAPGQVRSVPITARPEQAGALIASASTSIDQADYNAGNDSSTIGVVVSAPAPVGGGGAGGRGLGAGLADSRLVGRTFTVDSHGSLRLFIACSANSVAGCHDSVEIFGATGALPATLATDSSRPMRAQELARTHVTVPAGRTVGVPVRLNAAGRVLERLHRSFHARLLLSPLDRGHAAGLAHRYAITLHRAAGKHRRLK